MDYLHLCDSFFFFSTTMTTARSQLMSYFHAEGSYSVFLVANSPETASESIVLPIGDTTFGRGFPSVSIVIHIVIKMIRSISGLLLCFFFVDPHFLCSPGLIT